LRAALRSGILAQLGFWSSKKLCLDFQAKLHGLLCAFIGFMERKQNHGGFGKKILQFIEFFFVWIIGRGTC
jgi:hypothetical protein